MLFCGALFLGKEVHAVKGLVALQTVHHDGQHGIVGLAVSAFAFRILIGTALVPGHAAMRWVGNYLFAIMRLSRGRRQVS